MKIRPFIFLFLVGFLLNGCKDKPEIDCEYFSIDETSDVIGFSILSKIPGIWNGPVSSSTPLGNYPEWIVDFRPIDYSNVSAKNELDRQNDIFMSFFIVKHDCQNKIAFRNGGSFTGLDRISYMLIDSIFESSTLSYYRFTDPVAGKNRVYSDVVLKEDSLLIEVYTNKYNTLSSAVSHMKWQAKLQDVESSEEALYQFNFPRKTLHQNFTATFDGLTEAVYFNTTDDPYPNEDHPYLGQSTVNVNVSNPSVIDNSKKVLIVITTQPLFNGVIFNPSNLIYRSRYVLLNAETNIEFTFDNMHPGNYYVNALYDNNGDFNFSSGDFINSNFDVPLNLNSEGSAAANVNINFEIP